MDVAAEAKRLLAEKTGIGMMPPFYAETGSNKGSLDWPFWIVRNKTCNSLGTFMLRSEAEALAKAMNREVFAQVQKAVQESSWDDPVVVAKP